MSENEIIAVYLAAGMSRRMGTDKLGLPFGSTTIGNSSLQAAVNSQLNHIIVVTREEDSLNWIDASLFRGSYRDRWSQIKCTDADKGQSNSLKCGLRAAMELRPIGIMILLADQPSLSFTIINDLILRFGKLRQEQRNFPFIAASFQGIPRPPIIFSIEIFPELLKLEGDAGARQLFKKQASLKSLLVNYESESDFWDIDTMEDYYRVKGAVQDHD
ncbi:NTP transferase domain-containing protein [Neobacillus ginsengisoli]|uniref:Molybdenum cofactor cytidylyltransferase n=1 Tax=Neobacillus ginsengisoli TaxID=904295 RepID=A0ABT9Y021_9BACI|nr:NTP transferase domain-containing protein [Neobacillus ginsengisoli]MDQ0200502.1 molybdenum cofactor cytidylyltransferase [Neobacillus ginsengisoli]